METLLISLFAAFLTNQTLKPAANVSLVTVQVNERVAKKELLAPPECFYVNGILTQESASRCSDHI